MFSKVLQKATVLQNVLLIHCLGSKRRNHIQICIYIYTYIDIHYIHIYVDVSIDLKSNVASMQAIVFAHNSMISVSYSDAACPNTCGHDIVPIID